MAYDILVVDDEPGLREMVQGILAGAGYTVRLAGTCAQALQQSRAKLPDGVLLDVMLPDGDGFALLGQLRDLADLPVLFLSVRDEDADRLRGLGLGADDYITKPFLAQELLLRLGAVLRRIYPPACPAGSRPAGRDRALLGRRCLETSGERNSPDGQRVHAPQDPLGQPGEHRDHRRPVRCPLDRTLGGL